MKEPKTVAILLDSGSSGKSALDPAPSALLPAPVWLDIQASCHLRGRADRPGPDYETVIARTLSELAETWRECRPRSARELAASVASWCHGLDLDRLDRPARQSGAAEQFDHAASFYAALGSDLGRLVAAALVRIGDECEALGCRTLEDYLRADDLRRGFDLDTEAAAYTALCKALGHEAGSITF